MEKIILLVLVTIAKVIGILLAVLVIVALAILFAAVRYCGKISFDDKKAQISIRWLGVVLRVPILITEKDLQWKVRVFGVPILRSDGAHKKRRSKKSSAPKAQKRKAEKAEEQNVPKKQSDKTEEQIASKQTTDQREERSAFRQADEREKKPRGIRQLFLWLQNVIKIVRKIKKKVHSVQDILRSDAGKAFICIVKENVIHLWKQIHPRRMRGKVIFGTGDPCSTGELLGVFALFYAWYGNGVQIIPDFEQKRIEVNVSFRGRIRMITLICIAWRIIKNKDGRKLLHEWEKWKEEK